MIRFPAAAFTEAVDGDQRSDLAARAAVSSALGIPAEWATVRQVHGSRVVEADRRGDLGEADALFTSLPSLPLAVFTADCAGVVVRAEGGVGVAHAGWRGAEAGVVVRLVEAMRARGLSPRNVLVGPSIGPCCFEVGNEVIARFPTAVARTTWGTPSIDLRKAVVDQLGELEVAVVTGCTRHDPGWLSHRKDATTARMATVAWLP
jgi:YfiH family protein